MPYQITIGGKRCRNPQDLYYGMSEDLPKDFEGRANSVYCPRGSSPGHAFFLLSREDLDSLNKNTFLPAVFEDGRNPSITIQNLLFLKATCMTAGFDQNEKSAIFLAEFVDPRHVLWMSAIGSDTAGEGQYNVRYGAVPGATTTSLYYSESLNAGALWTWQTMLDNLWAKLPGTAAGTAPTLPYTPDGSPEGFRFVGVSAWEAINEVLGKISCAIKYDPITGLFSYVKLGTTQSGLSSAISTLNPRLLYSFWPVEANAARVPENIRVCFHRYDEHYGTTLDTLRTGSMPMDPIYKVDKASGSSGAIAGTKIVLWDDLPALYDLTGTLSNSAALSTRATEVAANYVLSLTTASNRMKRDFIGITSTILPGAEIGGVLWRDYGDQQGMITEVMNFPPENLQPDWLTGKLVERLGPPDMGRATLVDHPRELLGKIETSALAVGGSATIGIWRWDGAAYSDTTVNITAYDWLMKAGATSIAVGKKVIIRWFPDSERWFVVEAECA